MVILLIYIDQIWVFLFPLSSLSEHVWNYTPMKDSPIDKKKN